MLLSDLVACKTINDCTDNALKKLDLPLQKYVSQTVFEFLGLPLRFNHPFVVQFKDCNLLFCGLLIGMSTEASVSIEFCWFYCTNNN